MATKRFDSRLHMLTTQEERDMLDRLAEREGLRPSDMVRQLIRRAHAATYGEPPAKLPTKTRKRSAVKGGQRG